MMLSQLQYDTLKDVVNRWSIDNDTPFNYVKVLADSIDWGFSYNPAIGEEVAEVEGWTMAEDVYIFFIDRSFVVRNLVVFSESFEG